MARRAINIEPATAALEIIFGNRKWHVVAGIVAQLPGIEVGVVVQFPSCDCAFHQRPRGTLVGEEIALRQRGVAGLDLHIESAAGAQNQQREWGELSEAWR